MQLDEDEQKQADNYVLDISNTLWSNIPMFMLIFVVYVFLWKTSALLSSFESPEMRLIGVIVFIFALLQLVTLVLRNASNLEYKRRPTELKAIGDVEESK